MVRGSIGGRGPIDHAVVSSPSPFPLPLPPSSGDAAIPDGFAHARDAGDASDRRPFPSDVLAERLGGRDGDAAPVDPTVVELRRFAPFDDGKCPLLEGRPDLAAQIPGSP